MILFLSDLWLPFPGGAERLMFNLARDLKRRGERVIVFTGYENPQTFDGPCVVRSDMPLDADGWALIEGMVAANAPRVIVTHHLYARTFERELLGLGVPIVQIVLNGKRIPGAAFAVHISRWVRDRADAHVDDMVITPPVFDDVIAESHGDRIGFIKPIEHKGVELFYKIAERLTHRRFLVLRGEWQTLEDIRELPNVDFLQPVTDMRDFYSQCSMVLVPSRSEDAGTVGQECAVNFLPCISSNVDGLAETNGGLQLDRDDLDGWCTAIEWMHDDPVARYDLLREQIDHVDLVGQRSRLDEFARRVAALR